MPRRKTCIILNPVAGSVKDLDALLKQLERLHGVVKIGQIVNAGEALAREAVREKYNYIIAAGGDGTLNEVVNGVARHRRKVRIGLLPLGTGNDFARCLNLPLDVEKCIDVLLSGRTKLVDLVRVRSDQDRYFINISAGGFSGLVNEKLTPEIKRTWGPLAYIRGAAAALADLRAYRTDVTLDDEQKLSLDLYNVVVANGRFVAGGLPIAPEADPADGLLDIVLIPQRPAPEMALLVAEILLGKHLADETITFRRAHKVAVTSQPGMWFNVDGELVGNDPAEFEVLPRSLQFVVGQDEK